MDWKVFLKKKEMQKLGCVLLTLALLAATCLPVLRREQVSYDNPIPDEEIEEIEILRAGEAENLSTSSKTDPSKEGTGGGQSGGKNGNQGGSTPGESDVDSEGAAQEEKQESVESQPEPEKGPSLEDLSNSEIGTSPDAVPDGEQGQEDGMQGEEGGQEQELELGAVMYWYRYGTDEKTIVCQPNETVGKAIMMAQLPNNQLKYRFELVGNDAANAKITGITCSMGNSVGEAISQRGVVPVHVQADPGYQNYIFQVEALAELENRQGETVEQKLAFTYVIRCESGKDMELTLTWKEADGSKAAVVCAANKEASKSVNGSNLIDGQLHYQTALAGELADQSELIAAEYRTQSGDYGTLDPMSGTIELKTPPGSDREVYNLTFTARTMVRDEDGGAVEELITYRITLVYENVVDLQLSFSWFERGATRREMICKANDQVQGSVKNNQLSAGALPYEMVLTGKSAPDARLKAIACQTGSGSSGSLRPSGSVAMHLPDGASSETYTFLVTAQVGKQIVNFTVVMEYTNDVSLQMQFTTLVGEQAVTCENGKSVTAELVFDDQLTDGMLPYTMQILGNDAGSVQITDVSCYQNGTLATQRLEPSGSVKLQLDHGKTGENTFTVHAKDGDGQTYTFVINIPYKHRGENLVKIDVDLRDGQEITNGTEINFSVRAWVEDAQGNTVEHILATGTNGSKITVTMDGVEIPYVSTSGVLQEYVVIPENPEVGDRNNHSLSIYAEDQMGNYGELNLTLVGLRSQSGNEIGTAQVYIDMTVLGLGVEGPISYKVLAEEPISNVVRKVVWGEDTGEPFGRAETSFGWNNGAFGGTVEQGFYLQRLYPGNPVQANALSGNSWDDIGATEEEILAHIDNTFGRGSGLASLWRCIYRNGLRLSNASYDSLGEFDYTNGSGWLYYLDGSSYPGLSMSNYYLKDGDTLTLRYTLAQGWDVGTGTDGYGSTVGYCVTAANGHIEVHHRMEKVVEENGAETYVCHCCGITEGCAHEHTEYRDLGDGTHVQFCTDCQSEIGGPELHNYEYSDTSDPDTHTMSCKQCGSILKERHLWEEQSNTATCTEPGIRTVYCRTCGVTQEQPVPAKGHQTDNQFFYDAEGHYQICEICKQEVEGSRGAHSYVYSELEDDWFCQVCGVGHSWDQGHILDESNITSATCQRITYHCNQCGYDFEKVGVFDEYHTYVNGICTVCGTREPGYIDPVLPDPENKPDPDKEPEPDPEPESGGGEPPLPEEGQ